MKIYRDVLKPIIDTVCAFILLFILSPLLLAIIGVLIFSNRGNPFFIQIRPGKNEKHFRLIKFKTMTDERDDNGELLPDQERLTKTGKFIRKTSLDELPQLFNVVKGDMSFVGPRPLLVEYLPLYNEEQRKRHLVKPGITGWAQVNGRNAISWPDKFKLDVWYVENQSFWLDLKILWMTFIKVLKAEGISGRDSVTMEKFKGNE